MAKPKVQPTNSFNEWRVLTNDLSDLIGDVALVYSTDGTGEHAESFSAKTDLIEAVNDLNTRKMKRTGDTMEGSLHFEFGTQTSSEPFIEAVGTWNNGAVNFSGFLIDVANTASGSDSLLLDFRLNGAQKFGVDVEGAVIQKLTGKFLARDVVSGSRHVREYQDLPDQNANGLPNTKMEWGFTWNAGWNGSAYIKDRDNANDHAIMHRIDNSFRSQYWFSDGTTPGSAISFTKRIDFDFPTNTGWIDLATTIVRDFTVGANKLTVAAATGNTAVAGTLNVTGTTGLAALTTSSSATLNSLAVSTTTTLTGLLTTNGNILINGGTVTASSPFISATQTWNNAGVAFSGIKVNITNTASSDTSLLLDFQLAGTPKFGVDSQGAVIQKLTGKFLARDVVSGSRHVREYQDLPDSNTNGLDSTKNEWGFTWNAGWNGSAYIKDRDNAGDHAIMSRLTNSFKQQWWFSDGSSPGSAISFVKKVDFDVPANTYSFINGGSSTIVTPSTITTGTVNATTKLIVGSMSYFDAIEATTTSVDLQTIATLPIATYRSAVFEIQAVDATGGKFHRTNISFIHNGSTTESVEFGAITIGGLCGTYTTTLSAGNVLIQVTPSSANSTVFRMHIRLMAV